MSDEVLEEGPQEPEAIPEAAPSPPLDAVIVVKVVGDDGSINTDIVLNGGVQATEVQTLLELGLRGWRSKIGLSKE